MKYLVLLIPLTFLVLILVFCLNNKKHNFKANFNGVVFSSLKETKGFYKLQVRGNSQVFTISYRGRYGILDVKIGDSIYKERNSDIIYIKRKNREGIEELIKASYNVINSTSL
ncbi:hypothetical protein [Ferruginibacter sp.]